MSNVIDVSDTIQAKSDQLNAVDLVGEPITVTITSVSKTNSPDQPLTVHFQGDNGRPFKPSKTCRRILVHAWGNDANAWIGKRMTLYCDPKVRWAGQEIGGVRISHMSGIGKTLNLQLPVSRGKYDKYNILALPDTEPVQQVVKPNLTDAALEKNKPNMIKALSEGRTHDDLIANLQSRFTMTDQQIEVVRSLSVQQTEPEAPEEAEQF